MRSEPLFLEIQRFAQPRMRILTAIVPAGLLVVAILQAGFGLHWGKMTNGSLIGWTIFLWLVYFRLMTVKLVTELRPDELRVAMRGLWQSRRIPRAAIRSVKVVAFDARDWGGYGIRKTRRGTAYIAGGTQGVELQLNSGAVVLLGSARAEALARAIERQR